MAREFHNAHVSRRSGVALQSTPSPSAGRSLARGHLFLAMDALDTGSGWVVMESNETPGLSGFPDLARVEVARLLLAAMAADSWAPSLA